MIKQQYQRGHKQKLGPYTLNRWIPQSQSQSQLETKVVEDFMQGLSRLE